MYLLQCWELNSGSCTCLAIVLSLKYTLSLCYSFNTNLFFILIKSKIIKLPSTGLMFKIIKLPSTSFTENYLSGLFLTMRLGILILSS